MEEKQKKGNEEKQHKDKWERNIRNGKTKTQRWRQIWRKQKDKGDEEYRKKEQRNREKVNERNVEEKHKRGKEKKTEEKSETEKEKKKSKKRNREE